MTLYRSRGRVRRTLDAIVDAWMVAWRTCVAAVVDVDEPH